MRYIIVALLLTSFQLLGQKTVNDTDWSSKFKYRNAGPSRGGRVTTVTGVRKYPSHFYMGATGGGVWKTTDYGKSWYNVSDGFFETGSIGSIAVFQKNPEIVYAGTGSDGIRSNVIIGKGIYRSDDAGKSWNFIGLKDAGQIGAVVIHPDNPDIVWVAAIGNPFGEGVERGLFKTVNGGKSWEKVLYIGPATGVCDLEIDPGNPDIVYASAWSVLRKPWTIISGSEKDGIFKSEDGGKTWKKLSGGLPEGLVGKSDLAVTPAKPGMIYVLIEAPGDKAGLYVSSDFGKSFSFTGSNPSLIERPFYYTNIDVDPTNPDVIWVNCTGAFKSTDRGKTWRRQSTPHGDNHDIWFNPDNPAIMIQSNDGGANVSTDGGQTWSTQDNQPTAELYQVDVDDQFPYWLYAGQQDNSTIAVPSQITYSMPGGPTAYWIEIGGCETGPAVPKPGNHNIVYSNCKGRFGRYNKLTGQEWQYSVGAANMYGHNPIDLKYRFQRVSPIIVSTHNPGVVYHASQYLHKTMDEGVTWETISPDLTAFTPETQVASGSPITRDITGEEFYSTIYAVAESEIKEGLIWTGSNDGPVFVTTDGGKEWTNVTPKQMPAGGRVQTVEPSAHNPAKAYFAAYRYLLDDWKPYVYMTSDYGKTWKLLTDGTNGIPADEPVRVIREDDTREGLLFAGTEKGVYVSFNDGTKWFRFSQNLPVVPVTDIKIVRNDLVLSTMGRSFWIMDNMASLREFDPEKVPQSMTLFNPEVTVRLRNNYKAEIDYFLPYQPESLTLTILDSHNNIVKSFKGSSLKSAATPAQEGASFRGRSQVQSQLTLDMGINRFEWDLRAEGPVSSRRSSGPVVPPGKYFVRLNDGKSELTVMLDIVPDPAIMDDGVSITDMEEQFRIANMVGDLVTRVRDLEQVVEQNLSELRAKAEGGQKLKASEKKVMDKLQTVSKLIVTEDGPYTQPMLSDQVSYLYSMALSSEQKTGKETVKRYEELLAQVSQYEAVVEDILKK